MTTMAPSAEVAAVAHARRGGESLRCGRARGRSPSERTSERTRTSGGVGATVHLAGKDCTGVTADDHTARVYHAAVRPDRRVREKKGARCARVIRRHLSAPGCGRYDGSDVRCRRVDGEDVDRSLLHGFVFRRR